MDVNQLILQLYCIETHLLPLPLVFGALTLVGLFAHGIEQGVGAHDEPTVTTGLLRATGTIGPV